MVEQRSSSGKIVKVGKSMQGYYTIAQIANKVKKSNQAIYKLISNNKDLSELLHDNTITVGKGKQYSITVLEWIQTYYEQIEESKTPTEEEQEAISEENTKQKQEIEELKKQLATKEQEIALLKQDIEHLKEKVETAEKARAEAQEEKQSIYQQNGALLMLLAQEKQEKKLLLEAPRSGILGFLFGGKKKTDKKAKENTEV